MLKGIGFVVVFYAMNRQGPCCSLDYGMAYWHVIVASQRLAAETQLATTDWKRRTFVPWIGDLTLLS